jgi:hypothetical protein
MSPTNKQSAQQELMEIIEITKQNSYLPDCIKLKQQDLVKLPLAHSISAASNTLQFRNYLITNSTNQKKKT